MEKPSRSNPSWSLYTPFCLAALGQVFLIQKEVPWTLPLGLVLYACAALALWRIPDGPSPPISTRSSRKEYVALGSILLLAFLLRIYRLDRFPAGIFPDEGHLALTTERMVLEHWHPFTEIFHWPVCVPSTYYTLDAWFHLVPPSQISFFLYSVFVSLLCLPFLYFFYRYLSSGAAALIALFFLAVSRWFLTYSRDGHPAVEVLFYMGLTLALWAAALSSGKRWLFALCGLSLALGLYSYQDLKFLPILILGYAVYEGIRSDDKKDFLKNMTLLFVVAFVFSAPMLWHIVVDHGLSFRERQLLAFPNLYLEKGIAGVLQHLAQTLLVFNRQGDFWPYHNIPDHRQLGDMAGIFWVLGLFYALYHYRQRRFFYPLLGLVLFLLPAFLSIDSRHASRLIGTLPFVFLLAGQAAAHLYEKAKTQSPQFLVFILTGTLLVFSAGQNAWQYFQVQAQNEECWRVLGGAEDSWVADAIHRLAPDFECLLCQKFYGNFQISFLDYGLLPQIDQWKLPSSIYLRPRDPRKGICLFFEEGHWGALGLFQTLYPGGTTEFFRDLNGDPIAALYAIPAPRLAESLRRLVDHPFSYGLKGTYYRSGEEKGVPVVTQRDPVLNFTFRNDFPFTEFPPLSVLWSGKLIAPREGIYEWTVLTSDDFEMSLDGKKVLTAAQKDQKLFLKKGTHSLTARFRKTSGEDTVLNLLWKPPGAARFEFVPYQVLRPAP